MKLIGVFVLALFVPVTAAGQDTPAARASGDLGDLPVPGWAKAVLESFERPLHPIVGGVASSGGPGLGIGYDSPDEAGWYQSAEAVATVRRYWSIEGEIGRRAAERRGQIGAFGQVRHMNRIDYFGLGPETPRDNRSVFRMRETTGGARGWFRPMESIRTGGSVSIYSPDLGPGTHPSVPSIEQVFPGAIDASFTSAPTFARYRGFLEFTRPYRDAADASGEADTYSGTYQFAAEAVRDLDSGTHDFHRWEGATRHQVPGLAAGQLLTLHGMLASTSTGANVPFYMLYTLGGGGGLKSFRPDVLGTDGSDSTLRGYRNYRFRDRNLLLMQAEYRIPLHDRVRSTVFVDAGQVAASTSDLFGGIKTTTGFSLSYVHDGRPLGRVDVGFGGGEGVQVFWSFDAF